MTSATKTIALLGHFSIDRPEIGLSQFCRLAKRDKATTYRHLQALEETGFVEQNPLTKGYRLGPALLQLAQTRESTVPRKSSAKTAVTALAKATGETAHVSVLSGSTVYPLVSAESPEHSARAIIDIQTFPLHATASGLCALAFGPETLVDFACQNLKVFTSTTARTPQDLNDAVQRARETGFAYSNRSFEDEIYSISAPLFDHTGFFAGAVSVACVATRITPDLAHRIQQNLITASRNITRDWGGTLPGSIETAWADARAPLSSSQSNSMEATS